MRAIKNVRLKEYDYSLNNYYFVTICSSFNKEILLNSKKQIIESIERVGLLEGVKIDYYSVNQTHLHMIVLLYTCKLKLGEIVRRIKARSSKKSNIKLWQPNYYEHIIRNEKELDKTRSYIAGHPEKQGFNEKEIKGLIDGKAVNVDLH